MITELAILQQTIQDLENKNAELASKHRDGKFVSTGRIARTIAHEVRNPLTNINLAVEQLLAELPAAENNRFLFDMITRNSNRINQIITELLVATRFAELNFCRTSLHDILRELLQELGDNPAYEKLQFYKKFDPEVEYVLVDRDKIKQALGNLMINCVEAMEDTTGGILSVVTRKQEGKVIITISDNGKGMSVEDEQRIFDPYFTQKPTGMGLSLTITQNIILNHKGTIDVSTDFKEGTMFTITLKDEN